MGPVTADPVSYEGSVIVGSWDNRLYSVNAETGKPEWVVEAQVPGGPASQWIGSMAVVTEDSVPEIQPKNLSPHRAAGWSVKKFLTEFNAILNLTVHEDVAYLGTASGKLYAVPL